MARFQVWIDYLAVPWLTFWTGVALVGVATFLDNRAPRGGPIAGGARLAVAAGLLLMLLGLAGGSAHFVLASWVISLLPVGVAVAAFWRGDGRARLLSALTLGAFLVGSVCSDVGCLGGGRFPGRVWRAVLVDALVLAVCLTGVPRARDYWIIWASSFALLWLVTDLTTLFAQGLTLWSFAWASDIWGAGLAGAILWSVWQRRRAHVAASHGA